MLLNILVRKSVLFVKKFLPLLLLLLSIATFCESIINVYAASRASSATTDSPDAYCGKTTTGDVVSLTSPNYDSVKGTRTYFYLNYGGYLESYACASNSNRKAYVKMYEDDVYPNADDLVKTYKFGFSGRQLVKAVESITTNDTGNIDSSGDPTVELYITLSIDEVTGDTSKSNGPIFGYHFEID